MNESSRVNHLSTIAVTKSHERALVRTLLFTLQSSRHYGPSVDPAVLVGNLSNEYSGWERESLQQVAELLASEVSIVDALEQTPNAINPAAVMALRLANQTGSIEPTLELLIAPQDILEHPRQIPLSDDRGDVSQGGFQFVAACVVVSFLMIFIVPTIEKMFEEFGINMPETMRLLIVLSNYVAGYFWLLFLFFVIVFLIERRLKGKRLWRRGERHSTSQQVSTILDLLAIVVRQGRPVSAGLATLANYHPTTTIRARLSKASQTIAHGMRPWQALAEQGFISPIQATALGKLEPFEDLTAGDDDLSNETLIQARPTQAWMLQHIASRRQQQEWWRNSIWLRVISMGSLVVMALVVTLAAVAMFQSLYSLVESLA